MEVVIILIVFGIISYVIYQSLPNPKYQKAHILLDSGRLNEAMDILNTIFEKHPDAPAKLAECKLVFGQRIKGGNESDALKYFNDVLEIKKRLPSNASRSCYQLIEAKAFYEIANINFTKTITLTHTESKIRNIKNNLQFIENATKLGIENEFIKLKLNHQLELSDIYMAVGIQGEKAGKYIEAINHYSLAKDFAKKSDNSKVQFESSARIGISQLKNKEIVDLQLLNDVNKAPIEYRRDFFFRYARMLIQKNEYSESEKVISKHLNLQSTAVDKLKELVKVNKLKEAIKKINKLNFDLDQLYESSFPIEEIKKLYDNIDILITDIELVIPSITDKLQQIKPSLFNRLLSHYISEEQYGNAINLIQKFPLFWESPELLKDMGICCYAFTAQGNLSEKNFHTILSSWLTAVYCDKVILKSLEDTSWDDVYTFSLIDSIGSNCKLYDDLPVNINYNPTSESNISIGATQRELLTQFENLLHQKISDNSLIKSVSDFYKEEKEAIEKIVSILRCDILFAAPYFAKTNGLNINIIEQLENIYAEEYEEEALRAGIAYIKDSSDSPVGEYYEAKKIVAKLIEAISNENISEIKSIVAGKKKSLIENFDSIIDTVEDAIYNAFALLILEDDTNENLIALMNECIKFSTRNEKLKYQFSNFVTDFCIAKVNADEIDNFAALSYMKSAYLYSKDNNRICQNMITLIQFNLLDIINERTRKSAEIYKILDIIRGNRSMAFMSNASELADSRSDILRQLKNSGVDISQLTGTFSFSLTAHGELLKKALAYMSLLSSTS